VEDMESCRNVKIFRITMPNQWYYVANTMCIACKLNQTKA
jgi:hypothetical protein